MRLFNKFLSAPVTSWLVGIIAILCRVINVLFVSELGRDKVYLALQSKNLLAGNGLSVTKYFGDAPGVPVYDFTPMWPPGYPVLLAPFLKAFDYDVYWATTALDLISCIAIIFLVRKIALALQFPPAGVAIATLVAGCFDYAFIYQSLPTDASSFSLFLLGLFVLLKEVKKEKIDHKSLIMASMLLFLPCTIRYSYPPLSIAAFVAVAFAGWYLKNGILLRKGILGLSYLLLLVFAFFIMLKLSTGDASYIVETGRGFFPGHFFDWAPIGTGAFISTFFATSQLIRFTGISVDQAMNFLEFISAIMIAGFAALFFYLFFTRKFFKTLDPFTWFLLIGFFISAATCISLGYLSITYKPQTGWGNYLGEPRYFMFVTLYLQLSFIGWIFIYGDWKRNRVQKLTVYILSLLLLIEVSHNIYFNTKVVFAFDKYRNATYKEPDYVYFSEMIQPLIMQNPNSDIFILSHSDEFYPLMGSYLGLKGAYDGENFIRRLSSLEKRSIMIFALYDPELAIYQSFLDSQNTKFINRVNGVNFYRVDMVQ
ncbi:MAG TPA: hypothetical protein VFP97_09765 [Chitinophagaceae bacterium]|nr:hypothetical protein [Chitinophagaceae bacterium]